jgi:hypothetical protein
MRKLPPNKPPPAPAEDNGFIEVDGEKIPFSRGPDPKPGVISIPLRIERERPPLPSEKRSKPAKRRSLAPLEETDAKRVEEKLRRVGANGRLQILAAPMPLMTS